MPGCLGLHPPQPCAHLPASCAITPYCTCLLCLMAPSLPETVFSAPHPPTPTTFKELAGNAGWGVWLREVGSG